MSRRIASSIAFTLLPLFAYQIWASDRPNIIYLMTDDQQADPEAFPTSRWPN